MVIATRISSRSGYTTSLTNPGSGLTTSNALGGQSSLQLMNSVGTGYASTSSAVGR